MRRLVALLFAVLVVGSAQRADAGSILYFNDNNRSVDRMAAALVAVGGTHSVTTAASLASFTTSLSGGGYDLAILFQQDFSGAAYDAAFAAMGTHIAGGGAAIATDWTRNAAHALPFQTGFSAQVNHTSFNVTAPALAAGLVNPVNLFNPGWGVFSMDLTGIAAATWVGDPDAAIVIGNGGRTIFNGFLSDTFTDGAEGTQLYINEINATLAAAPEPGTIVLLGLGALGALYRRRSA